MKVLLINKYYYLKGGSETYLFGLQKMLEENGHEIVTFSMEDKKNRESKFEDYFVENVEYSEENGLVEKVRNGIGLIYSRQAYDKLCSLIESTKPDIAHVNLIYHQLTPSIFHALKKYNIPVVFTSHDYKLICPNYKLFNNNEICQKCVNGNYTNCFINSCHKDSKLYSLLLTVEAYYHKWRKSYDIADIVICPSKFMYNQLEKNRISNEKLVHLPNFLTNDFLEVEYRVQKANCILYYGRLSKEKGLDVLLDAKKKLKSVVNLKIIGTGPEEKRLKKRVQDENIHGVEFLGFKSGKKLVEEIQTAKATVIPAAWHEVFGLTIIESFSVGTPVIGSDVGGITELIEEGKNGFLFERNNAQDLANKIDELLNITSNDYLNMVEVCYNSREIFSPESYYDKLISIYEDLVRHKKIRK
jgi:glycosyltransferase involved in cell wall biosynthesis